MEPFMSAAALTVQAAQEVQQSVLKFGDRQRIIFAEAQKGFFPRVAVYFAVFTLVQMVSWRAKPGSLLALRPTLPAGILHATIVSAIVMAILSGLLNLDWWMQVGLPIFFAYQLNDILFFCIPKRSIMFLLHHILMMWTHQVAITDVAASYCGNGDAVYIQTLCVTGFVAEVPVPLMSFRWIVQKRCKQAWMRHAVDLLCIVTWVLFRLVLFPLKIWRLLAPERQSFAAKGNEDVYWVIVAAHVFIFLMSVMWFVMLLKSMREGGSKLANE